MASELELPYQHSREDQPTPGFLDRLETGAKSARVHVEEEMQWLKVHVRDLTFDVPVDGGHQNFLWLANTVKYMYAREHPAYHANQYTPVHVANADDTPLFPEETITNRCSNWDEVTVDLLGPKAGLNDSSVARDRTLWELYAFCPRDDWVPVVFVFDAKEFTPLKKVPGVFGNFNAWGPPIPMRHHGNDVYRHQVDVPRDCEVVFRFVVDGELLVSDNYYTVHDTFGTKMNYFRVECPPTSYSELRPIPPPFIPCKKESETEAPKVSQKVIGAFEGVKEMSSVEKAKVFAMDWKKIQLNDVVRSSDMRERIKEILRYNFDDLRTIFRYFSSQTGALTCMNAMKFISFCHTCKIPSKALTVSQIQSVFHRVNIEEEYVTESTDEYAREKMVLKEDPYNPDNMLIRAEFFEALARLAILKFPMVEPHEALDKLCTEYVTNYALSPAQDDIRSRVLDEAVQSIYSKHTKKIFKTFQKYAAAYQKDVSKKTLTTINSQEFDLFLADFKLIDKNLSRRKARTSFALSQEEEIGSNDETTLEMVYPEFLESIARMAEARYEKEKDLGLHNKLDKFIASMYEK